MIDENTSLLYRSDILYVSCQGDSLFSDLNIHQIINTITDGLDEYRLEDLYSQRPTQCSDAEYRIAVARDFWEREIHEMIDSFRIILTKVKRYLGIANSIRVASIRGKWKLDAAVEYIEAIDLLLRLSDKTVVSDGLKRILAWVQRYTQTDAFTNLREVSLALKKRVDNIAYSLKLDFVNNTVLWSDDNCSEDVCAEFMRTFDKYDLSHIIQEISAFADIHMNVLEEKIFSILQKEYPDLLAELTVFDSHIDGFIHEKILAFERESLFFLSYVDFAKRLEDKGFPFSFPSFSDQRLLIINGYDASLALVRNDPTKIVKNDFEIIEGEANFLLTGPNQGGKTTFSRMIGQILFFSSIGLPVPCEKSDILWTNGLKTHFNIEENPSGDTGRLKEELIRLNRILATTPKKSVVILNELFSSTTTYDGLDMGKRILNLFEEKECICIYITHLFELADEACAVSLIAEISADCIPTFKITRGPTAGNAFANRLLAKHRLRAADIKERTHAAFTAIQGQ